MNTKIVLASSSPRRVELLKNCHINFETATHNFDEDSHKFTNPIKYAKELAYGKANSISKEEFFDRYILGVDTIVEFNGKILGKPKDKKEAENNMKMLSNKTHRVISGISIVNRKNNIKFIEYSLSKVTFNKLDDKFIQFYLDNNLFIGYAGGYAIQGIFGLVVKKIEGSYSNIVGLPMEKLYTMLNRLGIILN
ncbi:MAG TPA: nucleoside triphosphate pyrophosphatase [Spirochaetota bacterium]|nr:nucleoside triphosphate pyrophosphatase [Spirochaetota bacterium]